MQSLCIGQFATQANLLDKPHIEQCRLDICFAICRNFARILPLSTVMINVPDIFAKSLLFSSNSPEYHLLTRQSCQYRPKGD